MVAQPRPWNLSWGGSGCEQGPALQAGLPPASPDARADTLSFQIPPRLQLPGAVGLLHHPGAPEIGQPVPLHPGKWGAELRSDSLSPHYTPRDLAEIMDKTPLTPSPAQMSLLILGVNDGSLSGTSGRSCRVASLLGGSGWPVTAAGPPRRGEA